MHEWYTRKSHNPLELINEYSRFEFDTDYGGRLKVDEVKVTSRMFSTEDDAVNYITKCSYGGEDAYMAAYSTKKLSKGYSNAFTSFLTKYNEYLSFKNELTIAYGRKSSNATCPHCGSSISLQYGKRFKSCPVCGSREIISDSNWKALETKKRMSEKAAENLSKEASKNEVMFVCGIEWHC